MTPSTATHVSLQQAMASGQPPSGNLAIPVFGHGSMEAELYMPVERDRQSPHDRDEIYVVARGRGQFYNGEATVPVEVGAFLFVPAGVEHRFTEFSDDFAVWVFFYGPQGGEVA